MLARTLNSDDLVLFRNGLITEINKKDKSKKVKLAMEGDNVPRVMSKSAKRTSGQSKTKFKDLCNQFQKGITQEFGAEYSHSGSYLAYSLESFAKDFTPNKSAESLLNTVNSLLATIEETKVRQNVAAGEVDSREDLEKGIDYLLDNCNQLIAKEGEKCKLGAELFHSENFPLNQDLDLSWHYSFVFVKSSQKRNVSFSCGKNKKGKKFKDQQAFLQAAMTTLADVLDHELTSIPVYKNYKGTALNEGALVIVNKIHNLIERSKKGKSVLAIELERILIDAKILLKERRELENDVLEEKQDVAHLEDDAFEKYASKKIEYIDLARNSAFFQETFPDIDAMQIIHPDNCKESDIKEKRPMSYLTPGACAKVMADSHLTSVREMGLSTLKSLYTPEVVEIMDDTDVTPRTALGLRIYSTAAYKNMNSQLREIERLRTVRSDKGGASLVKSEKTKEISEEVKYCTNKIETGCDRLPPTESEYLYRNMMLDILPEDVREQYLEPGNIITEKAITSFSSVRPLAGKWDASVVVKKLEHSKARSIAPFSERKSENEEIYLPGQRFRIISVTKTSDKEFRETGLRRIIHMEELEMEILNMEVPQTKKRKASREADELGFSCPTIKARKKRPKINLKHSVKFSSASSVPIEPMAPIVPIYPKELNPRRPLSGVQPLFPHNSQEDLHNQKEKLLKWLSNDGGGVAIKNEEGKWVFDFSALNSIGDIEEINSDVEEVKRVVEEINLICDFIADLIVISSELGDVKMFNLILNEFGKLEVQNDELKVKNDELKVQNDKMNHLIIEMNDRIIKMNDRIIGRIKSALMDGKLKRKDGEKRNIDHLEGFEISVTKKVTGLTEKLEKQKSDLENNIKTLNDQIEVIEEKQNEKQLQIDKWWNELLNMESNTYIPNKLDSKKDHALYSGLSGTYADLSEKIRDEKAELMQLESDKQAIKSVIKNAKDTISKIEKQITRIEEQSPYGQTLLHIENLKLKPIANDRIANDRVDRALIPDSARMIIERSDEEPSTQRSRLN